MTVTPKTTLLIATLLGGWELVFILSVLLLLLGAKSFPRIHQRLRRAISEFSKETDRLAHEAGTSAGGIFGKPAAEALTPDNQTAELYDPAAFRLPTPRRSLRRRMRTLIALVWLLVGAVVGIYCLVGICHAWREETWGELYACVIFLGFAAVCFFGATITIRNPKWGAPLLYISSAFALFYGGLYILFGGIDDTGWYYAAAVLFLVILSIATLLVVRGETQPVQPHTP